MQHEFLKATDDKTSGFTLIELSIVLVIIGLIVGGVLVGQDLIKAAEIRATVAQYEKYNSAVNTFRTKFSGIPGDLLAANVSAFGLCPTAGCPSGTTGLGDGNGLVQDPQATNANTPVGEPVLVWSELSMANLMDGSFGADLTTGTAQTAQNSAAPYLPPAKLGRGNYWIAGSDAGFNYWGLSGISSFTDGAAGTATYTGSNALTPIEAYNIDVKIDDGMPNTGIAQARDGTKATTGVSILTALAAGNKPIWSTATAANAVAGDCVTTGASGTDTTDTYARNAAAGNSPGCAMRMRFN